MRKSIYTIFLSIFILASSTLSAEPIDSLTAKRIACKFQTQSTQILRSAVPPSVSIAKCYTAEVATRGETREVPAFYVVNLDGGYVIVAADDRITPVLAYSTESSFDPDNVPENMAAFLEGYCRSIQQVLQSGDDAEPAVAQKWAQLTSNEPLRNTRSVVVGPLVKSMWAQWSPYNLHCPIVDNNRGVTGCVANSTSQIMHYWKYPPQGRGFHSYIEPHVGYLSTEPGTTTYDWEHMPDSLNEDSPAIEIEAISSFVAQVGICANMDYTGWASAANQSVVSKMLQRYFRYQYNMLVQRYRYSDSEWTALIKNELDMRQPVQYDGYDDGGGHAFVCDGYDNEDYFHFNWGWGGLQNGFFLLDASHLYPVGQCAVIGIHPPGVIPIDSTRAIVYVDTVYASSATAVPVQGHINYSGNSAVTERGFCWSSTTMYPTVDGDHIVAGSGMGSFNGVINNLPAGGPYFIRAYAINGQGVSYSDRWTFYQNYNDGQPCPNAPTVTDYDGNVYRTIQLGNLCWMAENLRTYHFTNGRRILVDSVMNETASRCYYPNDDSSLVAQYGLLYNNYSWEGHDAICPEGWHYPTGTVNTDFFETYMSPQEIYSCDGFSFVKAMVSATGWENSTALCAPGNNPSANNASQFNVLPAGCKFYANMPENTFGRYAVLIGTDNLIIPYNDDKTEDFWWSDAEAGIGAAGSIRCYKDETTPTVFLPRVATISVDNITQTGAHLSGAILSNGNSSSLYSKGFIYSTTPFSERFADQHNILANTTALEMDVTLSPNTTYYIRAYAQNSKGYGYGEEFVITTPAETGEPCVGPAMVSDHEGNTYHTVQIGNQCWTKENMRCVTAPSGTNIPLSSGSSSTTAYRYRPNNSSSNIDTYGYLYNWSAATQGNVADAHGHVRGICPSGWHLPSEAEWNRMLQNNQLDMKARNLAATTGWASSSVANTPGYSLNANNLYGFSALPAGNYNSGSYSTYGSEAHFASSTYSNSVRTFVIKNNEVSPYISNEAKGVGRSVRCIRDSGMVYIITLPSVKTNSATLSTGTSAEFVGEILSNGNSQITRRGFIWTVDTTQAVSQWNEVVCELDDANVFENIEAHLSPDKVCYVKAFANNILGSAYGKTLILRYDGRPCISAPTVSDIDGNTYNTICLGNQCWMKENVRTTRFADNTPIEYVSGISSGNTPAYFAPNNDRNNIQSYGCLYNWCAAVGKQTAGSALVPSGIRGICPIGWHLPSSSEFENLLSHLKAFPEDYSCGSNNNNIAKALVLNTPRWGSNAAINQECSPAFDYSTNNVSGFSLPPAGYFDFSSGRAVFFEKESDIWTSLAGPVSYCIAGHLSTVISSQSRSNYACSVRCIRDDGATLSYTLPTVITNPVTNATATSMTCVGAIASDGGSPITSRGFCIGTSSCPDTSNMVVSVSTSNNNFQKNVTGLDLAHNIYHVRAFAVNAAGISYGEDVVVDLSTHNVYTETSCESYSWHNQTYTQSDTYVYNYTNAIGCASADTLHLTILHGTHNSESISVLDEYTWHGQTYTESGILTFDYTNEMGCPSTDTLHLTILHGNDNSIYQTACESFTWRNHNYTSTGTYVIPYINYGPSSTVTIGNVNTNLSTTNVPFYNIYRNSWDEFIYTADEVGENGNIHTIRYQCAETNGPLTLSELRIYMGTRATDTYEATDDWTPEENLTLVYTGTNVSIGESTGWETYEFDQPFYYDGTSNLVVAVDKRATATSSSIFYRYTSADNRGLLWYSNTNSGTDHPTQSGLISPRRPNVQFDFAIVVQNTDTLHLTINHGTHNAITEDACGSYNWHGQTYTESDTYTYDYTSDNGCASTDTLHLIIHHGTHNSQNIFAANEYTWHGQTYTGSGTYTYDYFDENGCPSTDTLHLTIYVGINNSLHETSCESFTWRGIDYTTSGTYIIPYITYEGDSDLMIGNENSTYSTYNAPFNNYYKNSWNESIYSAAEIGRPGYIHTISYYCAQTTGPLNVSDLRIYMGTRETDVYASVTDWTPEDDLTLVLSDANRTIGNSVGWETYELDQPFYYDGTSNLVVVVAKKAPTYSQYIEYAGSNSAGRNMYVQNDVNASYADYPTQNGTINSYRPNTMFAIGVPVVNVDTLHLTINNGTHNVDSATAFNEYTWHGQTYTESGTYTYEYTNASGCASVDTLHLTIDVVYFSTVDETACDSLIWRGEVLNTTGTHIVTHENVVETPVSIGTTTSTSNLMPYANYYKYSWNESIYTADEIDTVGTISAISYYCAQAQSPLQISDLRIYMGVRETSNFSGNRDWTPISDLTLVYADSNISIGNSVGWETVTLDHPFHYDGTSNLVVVVAKKSTAYVTNLRYKCSRSEAMCLRRNRDSGDTIANYQPTFVGSVDTVRPDITFTFQSHYYNIDTVHLTINHGTHNVDREVACESYTWHGQTYTVSDTYTYEYTNTAGCPSVDTLYLTVNHGTHTTMNETAYDSYTWTAGDGQTYTESGIYFYDYENEDGCPSADTLYLTVYHSSANDIYVTACESYTWNDDTYTVSDDYTQNFFDIHGADSTVTLHLTINHGTHNVASEVACESYTWNGWTYTVSDTYTYEYTNTAGCPSVDTLHLTVNHGTHTTVTETAYDSYTWTAGDGQTYTESGTHVYNYTNAAGCPSSITLYLTIYHSSSNEFSATACESYTWNDETYTVSDDYTQDFFDIHGADSTVTLHLTINHGTHNVDNEVVCESYTWNGRTYTVSGTYTYEYTNTAGCPSVDTLHLTVNYGTHNVEVISAIDEYTWHGQTYTESDTYTYNYVNENGCPSTDTLHLAIYVGTNNSLYETACESFTWRGIDHTTSGTYIIPYITYEDNSNFMAGNENSTYTTYNAPFNNYLKNSWNESIYTAAEIGGAGYIHTISYYCAQTDEPLNVSDLRIYMGTRETDEYASVSDWTPEENLTLVLSDANITIGNSVGWETYELDQPFYYDGTSNLVVAVAKKAPTYSQNIRYAGTSSARHNMYVHNDANASYADYPTRNGTIANYRPNTVFTFGVPIINSDTLHLTINHGTHNVESATAFNEYTWHGQTYTESGTYTYEYTNASGCASVDTLHLTIDIAYFSTVDETACDSLIWRGEVLNTPGTHIVMSENADETSIAIGSATHISYRMPYENYFKNSWSESIYTADEIDTAGTISAISYYCAQTRGAFEISDLRIYMGTHDINYYVNGRDWTPMEDLTLVYADSNTSIGNAVGWETITLDHPFYYDGTYNLVVVVAKKSPDFDTYIKYNCTKVNHMCLHAYSDQEESAAAYPTSYGTNDSLRPDITFTFQSRYYNIDTVNLTINHGTHNVATEVACDSYTWHGQTYTESDTYTYEYTNTEGCPSVDTLHLTIKHGTHNTATEVAYDSYTWTAGDGQTYTESGIYFYDYENEEGCPSADTLYLTIYHSSANDIYVTACESYTWNDETYTVSDDYTQDFIDIHGADSTVTLHLTIHHGTHSTATEVAYDSYTWTAGDGQTYTESGTYFYDYENEDGCPSADTLHLTVYHSSFNEFSATACESYTWNDETYTISDDYTQHFNDIHGADSAVTLHLTIYPAEVVEITETAIDSYAWNDETYIESGNYTQGFQSSHGCDSTVTLHLTIIHSHHAMLTETVCRDAVVDTVYDYQIIKKNIHEEVLIPDATDCANGCKYEASVAFDNFDENAVVESVDDIAFARLKLEHSYNGDLYIGLTCPNGQHANILNRYNNDNNVCTGAIPAPHSRLTTSNYGADFGAINTASNSSDKCDPATNPIGTPWNYCWSNNAVPSLGFQYASDNALVYESSNIHTSIIDSTNTIDMTQVYHPDQSFEALIGCPMNGTWTVEIVDASGSDNGWVSEFEMALIQTFVIYDTLAAPYTWNGQDYNHSGIYTYSYVDEDEIPATDTLALTINYSLHLTENVTAVEEYTWHGETYTESGTYTFAYGENQDCPNVDTLYLRVLKSSHNVETVAACLSTQMAEMPHSIINRRNVQGAVMIPDAVTCNGDCKFTTSVVFNEYDAYDVVESAEDIAFVRLKMEHSYNADLYIGLVCPNGQHATILSRTGSSSTNSCASAIPAPYYRPYGMNAEADFGIPSLTSNSDDKCDPTTNPMGTPWNYCWSNNTMPEFGWQYASGGAMIYEDGNINNNSIDSTNTVEMTNVYHPDQSFDALIGCPMNGVWTIEIVDAGNGDNGWVSEVELALKGVEYRQEEVLAGCVWHYNVYTESGTYTYNYYNEDDQLSTDTLHLTVYPMEFVDIVESACESYTWNDQTYTESDDYTQSFQTVHGCDSTVTLHLTINHSVETEFTVEACDSYTWNDQTYTESDDYTQSFQTVHGCDSMVTLHLTINHSVATEFAATACDSYTWNDQTYTESNDYTQSFQTVHGCDSTVTLHLTINHSAATEFNAEACDSYTWNNYTYTESNDYTQSFQTVHGCDSTVTLHLTINHSVATEFTAEACDSYTWNNYTYTESNDYTQSFQTVHGCDSTVTLHLTINQSVATEFAATACDSYTWNDQTYTESNDYTQSFQTVHGCDSTVTLHLTINQSVATEFTAEACDSYTWNNQTYTESNDYTQSFQTVHGCDSTVTLHLTINQSVATEFTAEGCDSYTWNNQTYTESNDYTQSFQTIHGCDSTVTLHLTINQSVATEFAAEACDSYTWNNQTYTESNDYTQSFQTVHGCDSTVTLHLTINQSVATTEEITISEDDLPYTYNDTVFGVGTPDNSTFTFYLSTQEGCDSVVTLHLTITTGIAENLGTEISVYPNPTRDIVFLSTNRLSIERIAVYDIYGRLLNEKAVNDKQTSVDLSAYAVGTYLIRIQTDRGVVTKKIMREK